jgi:DNA repair protein RadC
MNSNTFQLALARAAATMANPAYGNRLQLATELVREARHSDEALQQRDRLLVVAQAGQRHLVQRQVATPCGAEPERLLRVSQEGLPMQQELFAPSSTRLPARAGGHGPSGYLPVYRVQLVRETAATNTRKQLRSSKDVADLLWQFLDQVDREHFVVIMVDRKNRLIGINTVSIGSLTASIVHPREVFKVAILSNAAEIICVHNHPSGDPQPSPEDQALTQRLVEAGKLLGIEVLDHVIIGDGSADFYSFADCGGL